ncbi:MAG TPA: hypothetical protein VJV78_15275 [Polyangiales bacterium]|nr:hypothetical protein [Polyangiales bacterium]
MRRLLLASLLLAACPRDDVQVAPTTANPLGTGVVCNDRWTSDEGDCQASFDDCSDGLTYDVECGGKSCDCLANGDKLGKFVADEDSACHVEDIGKLKILCGWNAPSRRTPDSE